MKSIRRIAAVASACVLAAALWPAVALTAPPGAPTMPIRTLPPPAFACRIGSTMYSTLDAALAAALPGQTVTLLRDIDCGHSLVLDGIKLDLDGHTLNIDLTSGEAAADALLVTNGGWMTVHDDVTWEIDGAVHVAFRVTGNAGGYAAVRATNHGLVEVSSIAAYGPGAVGALSEGGGSSLEVFGGVEVEGDGGTGIFAVDGGCVDVRGGGVTVRGLGCLGAAADRATQMQVDGDVRVYGDNGLGVYCVGCELNVFGNILAAGRNGLGAQADGIYRPGPYSSLGLVTVEGNVKSELFAFVQSVLKTPADKDNPPARPGYDTYTAANPWTGTTGQVQVRRK